MKSNKVKLFQIQIEKDLLNQPFCSSLDSNSDLMKNINRRNSLIRRVPFSQIINQEEKDLFEKKSNQIIDQSNQIVDQSDHAIVKHSSSLKKYEPSDSIESKGLDRKSFQTKGSQSIQLVSVVQDQSVNLEGQSFQKARYFANNAINRPKIPISSYEREKKFKLVINQEAVKDLLLSLSVSEQDKSVSCEQFVFCAMVGKTKTGKSFLLNELIKSFSPQCELSLGQHSFKENVFTVNHTLAPCTKGIWLSKQKIPLQLKGKNITVIFLDTQGLGSYESTQQVDYKLLTLSLLFSDIFCYNSVGPVDQQMLNGMSLAIEISKFIQKSQEKSRHKSHLKTSPSLLWILRDFSLELLTKDKRKISSDEYLESCLSLEVKNERKKSKQDIRKAIRQIFKNRKCSTMVMPFDEDDGLRNQFKNDLEELKYNFRELISQSVSRSNSKKPNKIEEFIFALRVYIEVLNDDDSKNGCGLFPKIQSLQTKLTNAKIHFQLQKFGQIYGQLFQKYQNHLDSLSAESQCRQNYLSKVNQLRESLQQEIKQIENFFKQKIKTILCLSPFLDSDQSYDERKYQNQQSHSSQQSQINFDEFLKQGASEKLIQTFKKNYQLQSNSIRQKKKLVYNKIEYVIESITSRSKITQQLENLVQTGVTNFHIQTTEWISLLKQTTQISELKQIYQNSIKEIGKSGKDIEKSSRQIKPTNREQKIDVERHFEKIERQVQICLKQLEVNYLKQKVNLMELSQFQNSSSSFYGDSVQKVSTKSYEKCYNCEKSFYVPYIIIPTAQNLKIDFIKTVVKEVPQIFDESIFNIDEINENAKSRVMDKKFKLEFIIKVVLNDKSWLIKRKFKDFVELGRIMVIMFPHQRLEGHQMESRSSSQSNKKNCFEENDFSATKSGNVKLSQLNVKISSQKQLDRVRSEVEMYLKKLNDVEEVRNSRIFQKFVKINKEYLDL